MNKYRVTLTLTSSVDVEVAADSPEAAQQQLLADYEGYEAAVGGLKYGKVEATDCVLVKKGSKDESRTN